MNPVKPAATAALADAADLSRHQLKSYLKGFDDTNHTRRAPGLPSHAAWILGHCAMTMHRAAQRLDDQPLPAADFIEAANRGGHHRFGTESICTGSTPSPDAAIFPTLDRCTAIFDAAADRLCATLRAAPIDRLNTISTFFGGAQLPLWAIAPRIVFHNGLHAGQLVDLRRALGMAVVLG